MSSLFIKQNINNLSNEDFDFTDNKQLKLKNKKCCIILFCNNSTTSKYCLEMWSTISNTIIGAEFLYYDFSIQDKNNKMKEFLSEKPHNELSWMILNNLPLIVSFSNGYIENLFEGNMVKSEILNFISRITCAAK